MKQNSAQLLWRTINKNKTKNKWKILQLIHLGIILTSIKLWSLGCKSCHDCKMKRNSIIKACFWFGVQPIQSPFAAQMHHINAAKAKAKANPCLHSNIILSLATAAKEATNFVALDIKEHKNTCLSVKWQNTLITLYNSNVFNML